MTALAEVVLAFNRNSQAEDELSIATNLVASTSFIDPIVTLLRACPKLAPQIASYVRNDPAASAIRPQIEHWARQVSKRTGSLTARRQKSSSSSRPEDRIGRLPAGSS